MEQKAIDLGRIKDRTIQENCILQLIFPEQGFVHLRVYNKEELPYMYTALNTVQPGSTDVSSAQRLGIAQFNINNAIQITYDLHLYQIFYGISPGIMRVRVGYPLETLTKGIDVRQNQIVGDFGFVDGLASPITEPSEISEFLVPPNLDVGFVFENVDTVPIKPLLYWHIINLRVGVLRNADLVYNIMAGKLDNVRQGNYIMRRTMGGISPYRYYPPEYYGVDYIPLDLMDTIDCAETTQDPSLKQKAMNTIEQALGYTTDTGAKSVSSQHGALLPKF